MKGTVLPTVRTFPQPSAKRKAAEQSAQLISQIHGSIFNRDRMRMDAGPSEARLRALEVHEAL